MLPPEACDVLRRVPADDDDRQPSWLRCEALPVLKFRSDTLRAAVGEDQDGGLPVPEGAREHWRGSQTQNLHAWLGVFPQARLPLLLLLEAVIRRHQSRYLCPDRRVARQQMK